MQLLREAADELIVPRQLHIWVSYVEPKQRRRVHKRTAIGVHSLVELLEIDVERDDDTDHKESGGSGKAGFGSKPPGRYKPRELLHGLTRELGIYLAWWGLSEVGGPAGYIRDLVKVAPAMEEQMPDVFSDMTRDIVRWSQRLREYAGLELTYQPNSSCMYCAKRRHLTVWIDASTRQPVRARCAACKTNWDQTQVGLLLDHIRFGGPRPEAAGRVA